MNEKDIVRVLKSEVCPSSVLTRIRETIQGERSAASGLRFGVPVGISIAIILLVSLVIVNTGNDSLITEEIAVKTIATDSTGRMPPVEPGDDYRAAAEELKYVFTYIGLILVEETERNRDVILCKTVPVIKNSIENTGKFINNKIGEKKL